LVSVFRRLPMFYVKGDAFVLFLVTEAEIVEPWRDD